eukprot:10256353-Alexandrium_andersonii.AAC.1
MAPKRKSTILRWGLPVGPPPGRPSAAEPLGAVGSAPAAPAGLARRPRDSPRSPADAPGHARRPPDGQRAPGLDGAGLAIPPGAG